MTKFHWQSEFPVTPGQLFSWHERPGAFERLSPPWQSVASIEAEGGIRDGGRRTLRLAVAGLPVTWKLEHRDYEYGRNFSDVQVSGPFRSWRHDHRFSPGRTEDTSVLEDCIHYEAPGCFAGRVIGEPLISLQLDRLFRFRHRQTLLDVTRPWFGDASGRKIAVTGATGAIGSGLCSLLETLGCEVVRLNRLKGDPLCWSPASGAFPFDHLEGLDAFIHLAGAPIARRWTATVKREVRNSRIDGTRFVVESLGRLKSPPATFVCSSAIGYYGTAAVDPVTEDGPGGDGFLADVCREWETAAAAASKWAERTVVVRTGVVIDPAAGALAKLLTPFRLGLGGAVGGGAQVMSWIGRDDLLDIYVVAVIDKQLRGVVNGVAPAAVSNADFSSTLARVLGRPAIIPAPAAGLRLAFGEMADETVLASQNVVPERLMDHGFRFRHPELEDCLRFYLGRESS